MLILRVGYILDICFVSNSVVPGFEVVGILSVLRLGDVRKVRTLNLVVNWSGMDFSD